MKKIIYALIFVFFAGICFSQNVVKVKDVNGLIKAIASNTTIELSSGRYNLSKANGTQSPNITWKKVYEEEQELQISDVRNLTIKGEKDVEIVTDGANLAVIKFRRCSNIKLNNLIVGHTINGDCVSPVLDFWYTDTVSINNCDLYGSGMEGLSLDHVNFLTFNNSIIRNCSADLVSILNCNNIFFKKSEFKETGNSNLIYITDYSNNVLFEKCNIHNNYTYEDGSLFYIEKSKNIKAESCEIKNNDSKIFVNDNSLIILKDNEFSGNGFKGY